MRCNSSAKTGAACVFRLEDCCLFLTLLVERKPDGQWYVRMPACPPASMLARLSVSLLAFSVGRSVSRSVARSLARSPRRCVCGSLTRSSLWKRPNWEGMARNGRTTASQPSSQCRMPFRVFSIPSERKPGRLAVRAFYKVG